MNYYELYVNFFVKYLEFVDHMSSKLRRLIPVITKQINHVLTNNLHNYTSLKFKGRINGWIKHLTRAIEIQNKR